LRTSKWCERTNCIGTLSLLSWMYAPACYIVLIVVLTFVIFICWPFLHDSSLTSAPPSQICLEQEDTQPSQECSELYTYVSAVACHRGLCFVSKVRICCSMPQGSFFCEQGEWRRWRWDSACVRVRRENPIILLTSRTVRKSDAILQINCGRWPNFKSNGA